MSTSELKLDQFKNDRESKVRYCRNYLLNTNFIEEREKLIKEKELKIDYIRYLFVL